MPLDKALMKQLEDCNWYEDGSKFHVFNSQDELLYYLQRSDTGVWWREDYGRFDFEQCTFNFEVKHWLGDFTEYAWFKNARFEQDVSFERIKFKKNVDFGGCTFIQNVDFTDSVFEAELYPCSYHRGVSFRNAIFKKHITFWDKYFGGFVDLSNSTFEKGVDFEQSIFKNDVLLFDSSFNKNCFFKNVEFKGKVNGWNITCGRNISFEWANFRQKANFSELKVPNGKAIFHGANFEKNAYFYGSQIKELDLAKSVIEKGVYFLNSVIKQAERETWRIIKNEFIKQNNRIESLNYHAKEMYEYERELLGKRTESKNCIVRFFKDVFLIMKKGNRTDKFVVFINKISNGFNLKPFRGIKFTFLSTVILYLLFVYVVKIECKLDFEYSLKYLGLNFKQALQFLNVTNWNLKPFDQEYDWAYGVLFFGRVIVGFGVYQTVQAFRKFGKL